MRPWLLLSMASCAAVHGGPPPVTDWSWQPDRASLPHSELAVLHIANTSFTERQAVRGGGAERSDGPISAYLFTHPSGARVLIDTGFGRRTAADEKDYPGGLAAGLLQLEMGTPAVDQLSAGGVAPESVTHLVCTHLHSDHAGGIEDFPQATLVVHIAEWASAQGKRLGQDPTPYEAHANVDALDFAADGEQPYGPFPDHVDLFGDDSLVLLPTPGHTPGHLSVLVNQPAGSFLLVGDAAWVDANWQQPAPKGALARGLLEHDWRQGMDALFRIRLWSARHPELVIIPGHEDATLERPAFPEPLVP